MDTLQTLFENYAETFPAHIAIEEGDYQLSYEALNQRANQLAHYLIELGAKPDTIVVISLERSVDFLISLLAVLKSGSAYLPIDGNQPKERLQFILQDSKAPILITHSTFKKQFDTFEGALLFLDKKHALLQKKALHNPPPRSKAHHLAYVIYTSGSTGTPKGVLIEQKSVINYTYWMQDYTRCQAQERVDFSSSPIFDMAVSVTLVPLILGLTVVLCKDKVKKDPREFLAYLAKARIHLVKMTPSYFKVLSQEAHAHFISLPHLKYLILGGENLNSRECASWLHLYPKHMLYNEYGPTETTVAVGAYPVHQHNIQSIKDNVPIAHPYWQINCHILNEEHQIVPKGHIGELAIGGVCVARGYLNQKKLTKLRFIEHPTFGRLYKTGDLCQQQSNGEIHYFGRIDDQIKIRGFRIEPGEIEKHLQKHPSFQEVAVVAQKDNTDEARLIAYYILKKRKQAPTQEELNHYLTPHLPEYMFPTTYIPVAYFPLNANGKLDKPALPKPEFARKNTYVAPKTILEKQLTQLWSQELGVPKIGVEDNFFELGGHSLSAARLVSKIHQELHKYVSLHDFYQATCIKKLAPLLKNTLSDRHFANIDYKNLKEVPLSDFQLALWMSKNFEPGAHQLNIAFRKRFQGTLNLEALKKALHTLIEKHEVLRYQINQWKPQQRIQNACKKISLPIENLSHLDSSQAEKKLLSAFKALHHYKRWSSKEPLILVQLFYLKSNRVELQFAMPHLIADDACVPNLLNDLSSFYLAYLQNNPLTSQQDLAYKKYAIKERETLTQTFEKNTYFWENYLEDSSLFAFPKEQIIKNMGSLPYSTYTKIPEKTLSLFKGLCEQQKISFHTGLSALLALSLRDCCKEDFIKAPYFAMNTIKSTREEASYDNSLGCFIRIEPIKIALSNSSHFNALVEQIQQSTLECSNYQQCSTLTKLAAIGTFKYQNKTLSQRFLNWFMPKMASWMQLPPMYQHIFQHSIGRLNGFKRDRFFLINLNMHSTFINKLHLSPSLFDLKACKIHAPKEDSLNINNIFEASFSYEANENTNYLILSANLKPSFREQIAKQFLTLMRKEIIKLSTYQKISTKG